MDTQQGTVDDFDFLQSGPASTSGRSDAEQLKGALQNERASPEILAFETDLIGRIEQNMDYQARPASRRRRLAEAWRQPVPPPASRHPRPHHPRSPPRRPTAPAACRRSR